MTEYRRYYKLQRYNKDGTPYEPPMYKKGPSIEQHWWPSLESCESNDQAVWEIVNNEFICEKTENDTYLRYYKLQKCINGIPYQPEEIKKGDRCDDVEYPYINECEIPGDYYWKPIEGKYICEEDSNNKIIINYTLAEGIKGNEIALQYMENPNDPTTLNYIRYRDLKGKETYETTYSIWGVGDVFKTFEFISSGDFSMWSDTRLFNNSQHIEQCTLHLNMSSYMDFLTNSFHNCPNLTTLTINNFYIGCTFTITDCPKLEYIDYGNYPGGVDKYESGDYLLFKNCPNVKTIKCTSTLKDKAMVEQKDLRNNNNIKWIITDTYD